MKTKLTIFLLILSFFTIDATIAKKKQESFEETSEENIRGVYISYIEYFDNFYGGSKSINQSKIDKMIDNLSISGFNTIFLHVSPFSDSIYESSIFPFSYTLTGTEGKNPGFDYLDYFIKKAHLKKIKVHAWINPYRISFTPEIEKISTSNPAYKLLNTSSIKVDNNGIYYNPSSEIVKDLILKQVEEIINKYDVDGIHFDDYFYMQKDIDKLEYENYLQKEDISLKDFRLMQTNDLIKRVYKLIKSKNSKILFSISPDGSINNNYLYHFADVKTWLSSNEYVDIIMPQIYYGFNNEYAPFEKVLSNWQELVTNQNIQIIPVLAFYKLGMIDNEAGSGSYEWINNEKIISRQVDLINNNSLNGFVLFRYDFLFNKNIMNQKSVNELENLKKMMKNMA